MLCTYVQVSRTRRSRRCGTWRGWREGSGRAARRPSPRARWRPSTGSDPKSNAHEQAKAFSDTSLDGPEMRPFHDRFSTQFWCFSSGVFAYPESLGAQLENGQKTANNWTKNGFEIGPQKFAAIIALRKALHATRNNTNNAACIAAAHTPQPPGGAQPGVRGPPAPHPHRTSTRWLHLQ